MSKKKILVVDDSRTALFMVTTILRKERYELVTACDGEQALEMAAAEHPDLILMDVIMPRKTGFEACRELKRREDTKAIPSSSSPPAAKGRTSRPASRAGATTT
jgi:CheY-like chemotaxis protein